MHTLIKETRSLRDPDIMRFHGMINDEELGGDLKQPKMISGGKTKIDRARINQPPDLNMYIQIPQGHPKEDWNSNEATRKPEHSERWIRVFFDISSDVSPGLPTNGKLTVCKMNEFRRRISLDSEKG